MKNLIAAVIGIALAFALVYALFGGNLKFGAFFA